MQDRLKLGIAQIDGIPQVVDSANGRRLDVKSISVDFDGCGSATFQVEPLLYGIGSLELEVNEAYLICAGCRKPLEVDAELLGQRVVVSDDSHPKGRQLRGASVDCCFLSGQRIFGIQSISIKATPDGTRLVINRLKGKRGPDGKVCGFVRHPHASCWPKIEQSELHRAG